MGTIAIAYDNFCSMLLYDRIYEDTSVSYPDICAALHVSPGSLDEVLEEELGMNGREILYSFQKLLNL